MTTTPNMNLALPDEGGSLDIWAVLLDAVFALVDAHDHTTGKGVPIPSGALNVNADIQLASAGSHYALWDAKAFDFFPTAATAVAGFAGALFMNSANSELTWRNASGTNVQLTNGAALNVASFVGGIGGDYSAVGALESYDDATHRYLLQQEGSPRPWAGLATGDIDLYQKAASIVNKVTLKSPNALAASYTLTLPAALPATLATLRVDGFGVVTAAAAALTMTVPAAAADLNSNARLVDANGIFGITLSGGIGNAGQSTYPLQMQDGDVITGIKVFVTKVSAASSTIAIALRGFNATIPANASLNAATLATNAPGATSIAITGLSLTVVAGTSWMIQVGMSVGAAVTDTAYHVEVTFQRLLA